MLALLIGGALAAGTFVYAKNKKKASTGKSAGAAVVTGAAGWGATAAVVWAVGMLWPVLLVGGAAGAAYYLGKKKSQKALPPASAD
jgi:hypothetical protein